MIGLESKLVAKYGASGSAIGTVNGPSIDTKGFYAALVVLSAGAFTATGTLAVKVQTSSDNNVGDAWADLPGAVFATLTDATDEQVQVGRLKLDGNTCERYIRIVSTVATAAAPHGVAVILKGKQYLPQTDEAAEFTV